MAKDTEVKREGNVLRLIKKATAVEAATGAASADVKDGLAALSGDILQLETRLKNLPPAKLRELVIAQALKLAAQEARIIRIENRLGLQ